MTSEERPQTEQAQSTPQHSPSGTPSCAENLQNNTRSPGPNIKKSEEHPQTEQAQSTLQNSPSGSPSGPENPQDNNRNQASYPNVKTSEQHPQTEQTKGKTINVVLFGETGVGKSSVINLIARKNIAKVSSDVNGCTMQSTPYKIRFDDIDFTIFDTIGLEEPQMGVNGYLKAIEKAYELILKLGDAGGIHLLLFCMRGGRITATTQSNYRLFCECLCNSDVPVALVFTGLEREVELENWWMRNKSHIEHYGIKSMGHACVTAVQDEELGGEDIKFKESQERIRILLKDCALKSGAYRLDSRSWFAKFGRGLLSFIEKAKMPRKRDVMKVLTKRCKLDPETAGKIADMIRSSDQQKGAEGHQVAAAPSITMPEDTPKDNADDASAPGEGAFVVVKDQKDAIAESGGVPIHRTDSGRDKKVMEGIQGLLRWPLKTPPIGLSKKSGGAVPSGRIGG